jgi:hypothetical protein
MIFHSPLLNILINLVSVGKYNFFNWGTFVPQGTVYGVFLMGTVPGLMQSSNQNLPLSKEEGIWKRKIGV